MASHAPKITMIALGATLSFGKMSQAEITTLKLATLDASLQAVQTITAFTEFLSSDLGELHIDVFDGDIGSSNDPRRHHGNI